MPPQTISDADLVKELLGLFRAGGFDGVSLSDLQEATGLKRSSLYHRFPGGKLEMAVCVLDAVEQQLQDHVLSHESSESPLVERIEAIGEELSSFYDSGRLCCLFNSMTLGLPADEISERASSTAAALVATFSRLSIEAGKSPSEADEAATDAFAAIQGALVVSRLTGSVATFTRAIASLPARLGAV